MNFFILPMEDVVGKFSVISDFFRLFSNCFSWPNVAIARIKFPLPVRKRLAISFSRRRRSLFPPRSAGAEPQPQRQARTLSIIAPG